MINWLFGKRIENEMAHATAIAKRDIEQQIKSYYTPERIQSMVNVHLKELVNEVFKDAVCGELQALLTDSDYHRQWWGIEKPTESPQVTRLKFAAENYIEGPLKAKLDITIHHGMSNAIQETMQKELASPETIKTLVEELNSYQIQTGVKNESS